MGKLIRLEKLLNVRQLKKFPLSVSDYFKNLKMSFEFLFLTCRLQENSELLNRPLPNLLQYSRLKLIKFHRSVKHNR